MFSRHYATPAALLLALGTAQPALAGSNKPTVPLNDTGMTQCVVNGQFTDQCTGTGQDGEFGRDVSKPSGKDGMAGFSYQKLCNSGEVAGSGTCPGDPKLGNKVNQWGCTQDKVTGLIWEVKTKDGGLRDWKKTYTNYGDGSTGDASELAAKVNAQGLCGAKDWEVPSVLQLLGLINSRSLTIDQQWFPNEPSTDIGGWTNERDASQVEMAWYVDGKGSNFVGSGSPSDLRYVQLVRASTYEPVGSKRFKPNDAGDQVTDTATGLIWRRCSEGQTWKNGSCEGVIATYWWFDALAQAQSQAKQSGLAWRLPNLTELASLIDRRQFNPAADTKAFPYMAIGYYWSATPSAWGADSTNVVDFERGAVSYWMRVNNVLPMRLVRNK